MQFVVEKDNVKIDCLFEHRLSLMKVILIQLFSGNRLKKMFALVVDGDLAL